MNERKIMGDMHSKERTRERRRKKSSERETKNHKDRTSKQEKDRRREIKIVTLSEKVKGGGEEHE